MSTYEGLFLLNSHRANRDWDEVFNHVVEILKKHGGEMVRHDKWGERKLAYPIQREKRGVYLLAYFTAPGDAVTRIYRECEISEIVIRAMILAVSEVPPVVEAKPAPPELGDLPRFRDRRRVPAEAGAAEAPEKRA